MPDAGGAAALHGFLFQLLNSIEWAVQVAIANAAIEDGTVRQATMTLEPATGGDVRYQGPARRVVEQFKTRANGTWSVRTIIDEILPDLYRSIGPMSLDADAEYAFVTDGRYGQVGAFCDFLALFAANTPPERPLTALPDAPRCAYLYRTPQSARAFFRHIIERVREPSSVPVDVDFAAQRRVWHLLTRFKLRDPISIENLQHAIDARLGRVAVRVRDVPRIRQALIGALFEQARKGNAILSVDELLTSLDLPPERFRQLVTYARTLTQRLEADLRHVGYRREFDVRGQVVWPEARPVLALIGESGEGKTWRLARLAHDLSRNGEQVVFVASVGDLDHLQREIVSTIWVRALAHEDEISFLALEGAFRRATNHERVVWLTVCIDELPNWRAAREIIRFRWEDHGIRLALCLPTATEDSISAQAGERAAIVRVQHYKPRELRVFLESRGCRWDAVPSDTRRLLHKPLLADIYCTIAAGEADWVGRNEYELFERFWRCLSTADCQADFPDDPAVLLNLVARILSHPTEYPWTFEQRHAAGDSDGTLVAWCGWAGFDVTARVAS